MIIHVRRRHRWWKRLLTLDGRLPLEVVPLTVLGAAVVAFLVLWLGR